MDNHEWLKQRRLKDLRRVSSDKVLQLIDEFYADLQFLNQQLKDRKISPSVWIRWKQNIFHIHVKKLRQLDRERSLDTKTFGRVMSVLCEDENPAKFDYKLLMSDR